MSKPDTHIIINPVSAAGRTKKRIPEILDLFSSRIAGRYTVCVTKKRFDASRSAFKAVREGCRKVIAVGGDGTINEVVNGLICKNGLINNESELGVISSGTGCGFAQSLGLPDSIKQQVNIACFGHRRVVDVGKVTMYPFEGCEHIRFFVNECQSGLGGAVVKKVEKAYKSYGGFYGFALGAFNTALRYPNQMMSVCMDNKVCFDEPLLGIVVASGAFTGGGMNLTPRAKVDDGLFDVLFIRRQGIGHRLWNFPRIYSGKHIDSSRFSYHNVKMLSIASEEKVLVEADGELLGYAPYKVEAIPRMLNVCVR